MTEPSYFRLILQHNQDELEKVRKSMEVWGREAKTLAQGLCVKAYPGWQQVAAAYTFESPVRPVLKLGFRHGAPVVREVHWPEGHAGVEYRQNNEYVCIRISRFESSAGGGQ